jgi:hypothetical protein
MGARREFESLEVREFCEKLIGKPTPFAVLGLACARVGLTGHSELSDLPSPYGVGRTTGRCPDVVV